MKKGILGIFFILLLLFITGCGGSSTPSEKGAALTSPEANQKYDDVAGVQNAFNSSHLATYITAPYGIPLPGVLSAVSSSSPLKLMSSSAFTWSGPDADGWYSVTLPSGATVEIRLLASSGTIQEHIYNVSVSSGTISGTCTINISMTEVATNCWNGTISTDFNLADSAFGHLTPLIGNFITDLTSFWDSGTSQGCGTADFWISGTAGSVTIPRTQYAHLESTYDSTPPASLHLNGWKIVPPSTTHITVVEVFTL